MEYKIKFTQKCLTEIDAICSYISNVLKSEQASLKLRDRIKSCSTILTKTPKMYPIIEKFDKLSRGYRKITINNYVLLYAIDEESHIIYVSHMYYSGRNYLEILEN